MDISGVSTHVPSLSSQNLDFLTSQRPIQRKDGFQIPLFSNSKMQTINHIKNTGNGGTQSVSFDQDKITEKYDLIRPDPGFSYKPVSEIPKPYQHVFGNFPHFNKVQSKVFDDVLYSDNPIVVSAPTGSGKTAIFELAIVRVLIQKQPSEIKDLKIIYMAPLKILCSERLRDWELKFKSHNLKCIEVTGDTDVDDYGSIKASNLIFTTPEKWDSITRRWKEHSSQMKNIVLFLIDEVHMVGDIERGSIIEAVISRMKCIRDVTASSLRFIAVSATIPNTEDFASWLSSSSNDSICFKLDESYRPVPLKKVVLSFNDCNPSTAYKFDLNLNYKLHGVIQQYSSKLPTVVFCSTRKGTVQAASILQSQKRFVFHNNDRQFVKDAIGNIVDSKLRELLISGIGYHHAGLSSTDRKVVEDLFKTGYLPVICATSTLAMGVNLPAHLVIVKSTLHYASGKFREYSASDVLQMIGRAGRPQYDTSAVSVIMTQNSTRNLYTDLINGTQVVESNFHLNLTDHLNAEIVLKTLTHIKTATQWMMSLFLYVRISKNPARYGLSVNATSGQIRDYLYQSVLRGMSGLRELGFIIQSQDGSISPTETGALMARYCITFRTMKKFTEITGNESLNEILDVIATADEFSDVQLRVQEKSTLNLLNKNRNGPVIRYPYKDRIKTPEMKISVLIQAVLGCMPINEFSLNQESVRIVQVAGRLSKCLFELQSKIPSFNSYVNCLLFMKCLNCKLWENSKFLARQFKNIGPILGHSLANAGITSLTKLTGTDPRELELITNKNPPFGSTIVEVASSVPQYDLFVQQIGEVDVKKASLQVVIKPKLMKEPTNNTSTSIIIGTPENELLFKQKVRDRTVFDDQAFQCEVVVYRAVEEQSVIFWIVSHSFVGADLKSKFSPKFKNDSSFVPMKPTHLDASMNLKNKMISNPYKKHQNPYANKLQDQNSKISQKLIDSSRIMSQKMGTDNASDRFKVVSSTANDQFSDFDDDLPDIDAKVETILQQKLNSKQTKQNLASSTYASSRECYDQNKSTSESRLNVVKPILKKSRGSVKNLEQDSSKTDYLDSMIQEMEDSGYFEDYGSNSHGFDVGVEDLLADDNVDQNNILPKIYVDSDSVSGDDSCQDIGVSMPNYKLGNQMGKSTRSDEVVGSTIKNLSNYVIRIDENGDKFRECGHRCSDKKTCSHFCCRYGVKVKAPNKNSTLVVNDGSSLNNKPSNEVIKTIRSSVAHTSSSSFISNQNSLRDHRKDNDYPNCQSVQKLSAPRSFGDHANSKEHVLGLKRKYVEAFPGRSETSENVPVAFEATQPPKFSADTSFYDNAVKSSKHASFSSIFDGIF